MDETCLPELYPVPEMAQKEANDVRHGNINAALIITGDYFTRFISCTV
jgi:hypothetical protein